MVNPPHDVLFAEATDQIKADDVHIIDRLVGISRSCGDERIKVMVDGEELELDAVPVFLNDGTVLVPMHPIFEWFGMNLKWDAKRDIVTTTTAIGEMKLRIGSDIATLSNGKVKLMPTYIRQIDGQTMVPLMFIAESMNVTVNWLEAAATVNIISNK